MRVEILVEPVWEYTVYTKTPQCDQDTYMITTLAAVTASNEQSLQVIAQPHTIYPHPPSFGREQKHKYTLILRKLVHKRLADIDRSGARQKQVLDFTLLQNRLKDVQDLGKLAESLVTWFEQFVSHEPEKISRFFVLPCRIG
jgi:hypothetical protein